MPLPAIDIDLVRRLEWLDTEFSLARVRGLAGLPGNPHRAEVAEFGGATAAAVAGLWWFNRLMGLDAASAAQLDAVDAFYAARGESYRLVLAPDALTEALGHTLAGRGWAATGFMTMLVADPAVHGTGRGVAVDEVAGPCAEFGRVLWDAFDPPSDLRPIAEVEVAQWASQPAFRRYLACVDGQPAGAAGMWVDGDAAYLSPAAVLPAWRRRGAHTAMLHRRLADAAAAGCTLAVSQTAFGTASQHNMERAGFRIAYTKTVWKRAEGAATP